MNDHAGGLFFILTLENCINMLSHIQLTTLVIFTSVMIYDFLTTESRKKASFMLRMESYAGDKAAFYAIIDGHYIGITQMLADGWTLHNEIGIELDIDQAWKIRNAIKEHQTKK